MSFISWLFGSQDEVDAQSLLAFKNDFPKIVQDWAVFKAGLRAGLFTPEKRAEVIGWYFDLPKFWELIRPNFVITRTPQGSMLPITGSTTFAEGVDKFVARLSQEKFTGLGIAPLILGGIIVAGVLGAAGLAWGIAYYRKQQNISRIISEATAGRLPASVVQEALKSESAFLSPLGDLSSIVKWVALGVAGYLILPVIAGALSGRKKA